MRKESIGPRAFAFAVGAPEREINLLVGHSFNQPLASRQGGTLTLVDTDDALSFTAQLPPIDEQPSYMRDAVLNVQGGRMRGLSPGFTVPPRDVVPDAEVEIPEPGNPGVAIRLIQAAVLYELSLVTRPAYQDAEVEARALAAGLTLPGRRRLWL